VEISRIAPPPGGPIQDRVIIDIPGHGEIAVGPDDIELVKD
jgi:hypothetical protein